VLLKRSSEPNVAPDRGRITVSRDTMPLQRPRQVNAIVSRHRTPRVCMEFQQTYRYSVLLVTRFFRRASAATVFIFDSVALGRFRLLDFGSFTTQTARSLTRHRSIRSVSVIAFTSSSMRMSRLTALTRLALSRLLFPLGIVSHFTTICRSTTSHAPFTLRAAQRLSFCYDDIDG